MSSTSDWQARRSVQFTALDGTRLNAVTGLLPTEAGWRALLVIEGGPAVFLDLEPSGQLLTTIRQTVEQAYRLGATS